MDISNLHVVKPILEKELPDFSSLTFGKYYTDRIMTMNYNPIKKWQNAKIEKFRNLTLSPATTCLHYSQEIFEGLKAYYRDDGKIGLFRPKDNFQRMNNSAFRMNMPNIDIDFCIESLQELIKLEKRWIPKVENASLYIRPTMLGIDPMIGLKSSENFLFFIILSPVGAYFQTNEGIKILTEEDYVRAIPGGTGEAKTGGNYAASLIANQKALSKGYSQVLWLDGKKRTFIEEVGTMNIFFVYKDKVRTPALNGSILPGITRDSVIKLSKHIGIEVEECTLDINEVIKDIENGNITECFGSGTAVVITPVSAIGYKDKHYKICNSNNINITQTIYKKLTDIQYGKTEDPFGWTVTIE
jgi:branched-chain amino acid aminotransferase